jgi:hypothetical protein
MRIIRKRRRRNPKLSVSTIGKIDRREAQIARMLERLPDNYHRAILIQGVRDQIATFIRTDERLADAKEERERDKARAHLARPRSPDRRLKAYRDAAARGEAPDMLAAAAASDRRIALRAAGLDPLGDLAPAVEPVIAAPVEPVLESVAPPADDWRAQIRAAAIADGVPLSDLAPEQPSR